MTLSPKTAPAQNALSDLQHALAAKLTPYFAPLNLVITAAVALSYFLIGRLGLHPETPNHSVTAIWLPAGISLAACILWGNRAWPGVYLGSVLVTFSIVGSIPLALVFAANVTLSGLLGASLIRKFANGAHAFFKTGDVLRFIFFGAVFTPALSATVGVSLLCAFGLAKTAEFSTLWFTWWVGDMLGIFFLTPFIVLLFGHKHHSPAPAERLEITALVAGLSMMCVLNFGLRPVSWIPGNGFLFLCAPFLVWAALRFCPRGRRRRPHHGRFRCLGFPAWTRTVSEPGQPASLRRWFYGRRDGYDHHDRSRKRRTEKRYQRRPGPLLRPERRKRRRNSRAAGYRRGSAGRVGAKSFSPYTQLVSRRCIVRVPLSLFHWRSQTVRAGDKWQSDCSLGI